MKLIRYIYPLAPFEDKDPVTGVLRTIIPSYETVVNSTKYIFVARLNPQEIPDADAAIILMNKIFEEVIS